MNSQVITTLCEEFIRGGKGYDLAPLVQGRQYVVAYIPATSYFSDIGRYVETKVFSSVFELPEEEVMADYGKYDDGSTFACVIDVSSDVPTPAGCLRIVEYVDGLGFKDVNDLVADSADNPWLDEIKDEHFRAGERYAPDVAWGRICRSANLNPDLSSSLDIATHASVDEYRGVRGKIDGVSMLFYHACLRYALAHQKDSLLAIFDLKPFENLQQFGNPFSTHTGLTPHPYGGPYDTIPAYLIIPEGLKRMYEHNSAVGRVFEYGEGLNHIALLPNEYEPDLFSDEAVGLKSVPDKGA